MYSNEFSLDAIDKLHPNSAMQPTPYAGPILAFSGNVLSFPFNMLSLGRRARLMVRRWAALNLCYTFEAKQKPENSL